MMTMGMTQNQKDLAKQLQKSGISRHDSKIYAKNTSDFMFQTGVAYVSGVMTAATVGAARMVGHGIGWCVGKAVGGVSSAIAKKMAEKESADKTRLSRVERKAERARAAAMDECAETDEWEGMAEWGSDPEEAVDEVSNEDSQETPTK